MSEATVGREDEKLMRLRKNYKKFFLGEEFNSW